MLHMRTRRVMPKLTALAVVAFFAVGLAFGQAKNAMQFEVPYEFSVGSQVLPAGPYTFSVNGDHLVIKSVSKGQILQRIVFWMYGPQELLDDGSLVFDNSEGKRILSEVWLPGLGGVQVYTSSQKGVRDVVLASALNENRTVSGKVAFHLTCARCHGADGGGDLKADKFFKTTIPRLNSLAIQGKSDMQLKEIITKGTSVMPPVEIEEGGFRHRLPAQDVDAVIAYLRTLKK
jgi:mono/diheme cytochrome c family protein